MNQERIEILANKLRVSGTLQFVTDVEDYFKQVIRSIEKIPFLRLKQGVEFFDNYVPTKYHQKALAENRSIFFLTAEKVTNQ
jgi:tRNA G46 methylase TrmB